MNIILIIFLIAISTLIYIFFQKKELKNRSKPKLDHSLDKQLLIMLGGDKKTALRLLRNVRKNHPGKSYLWYHEKVIFDLERDRRY